jgi:hypothetical protein
MDPPYKDGVYTPWSFMVRCFDADWAEAQFASMENAGLMDVNRVLSYWMRCQEKKAKGIVDEQNPFYKIALITVEVQHG